LILFRLFQLDIIENSLFIRGIKAAAEKIPQNFFKVKTRVCPYEGWGYFSPFQYFKWQCGDAVVDR